MIHRRAVALLTALLATAAPASALASERSAVVLMYHHVADDTPAATSVRPDVFAEHLDYLADNDYDVWPLERLVEAVQAGEDVPARTVAITFDDAYESVYAEAWPELRERDWPFTVFVSTDAVGDSPVMDWDQLRELEAADDATLANHSASHAHLARPRADESEADWRERVRGEVNEAQDELEERLDADMPQLFAWPYGEFSPAGQALLDDLGYIGFGQQSGAIGPDSDFTALPRFPMAVGFDDLDTFETKVASRPLPVTATDPDSGVMAPDERTPELELELGEGDYARDRVACYSRGSELDIEWLNDERSRLRVTGDDIEGAGRVRFVCTAPGRDTEGWYWYSFQWMMPHDDGTWYSG